MEVGLRTAAALSIRVTCVAERSFPTYDPVPVCGV